MSYLLAFILGIRLDFRPSGMSPRKYVWRCFVLKFFFRHKSLTSTATGHDYYVVHCDDLRCLTSCRRQKKLAEWEAKDTIKALPQARLL